MNLINQFHFMGIEQNLQPLPAVQVGFAGKKSNSSRNKTTECSDGQPVWQKSAQED